MEKSSVKASAKIWWVNEVGYGYGVITGGTGRYDGAKGTIEMYMAATDTTKNITSLIPGRWRCICYWRITN